MKQVLLAVVLGVLVAVAAGDKRPLSFGQRFAGPSLQRQEAPAGPEAEDLSPPAPPAPGTGPGPAGEAPPAGDAGGPYPPSGQPENAAAGPYPPSGWKPQGQRLELPPRPPQQQQWGQPQKQYGAPPKQPQQQYGAPPKQPQQQYGAPPKQPQQQYGAPPKQPQQQYGAPPKQPQQQYGAPPAPAEPEPTEAPAPEPSTESPDQVAVVNNKLRQQLRLQRVALQRLRQQVRDQQSQLEQLQQLRGVDARLLQQQQQLQQPQQQEREHAEQGQYVVTLPDGRLQKVQFAATPSSTSIFKQSVPQDHVQPLPQSQDQGAGTAADPPTYVARLQFMDVPPIDSPVFSYSGSAPLVRVA